MKSLDLGMFALAAIAATSMGCVWGSTSTAEGDDSETVSAEQALAAHVPVCTKIGTSKEGWRWGDTGSLIRKVKCEGLTAQCQNVGTSAEGWYANGLITQARCAAIARVHAEGEACGPSIGYSCDSANAYCQGLPAAGTLGGSGVCMAFGGCGINADCGLAENAWTHAQVPGASACVAGQCTWIPEDCRTTADCQDGMSCVGIPSDGSTKYGKCRSTEPLVGEGSSCGEQALCEAELACVGLSMGPEGMCLPAWMAADYTNAKTYGTTSNVVAYGLATVPVDIVVSAVLNKNPSSWTLKLTDPNGVAAVVCGPSAEPCTTARLADGISVQGNSRDDKVNGRWTLQVQGSGSPKIKSWTLHLSSRWD